MDIKIEKYITQSRYVHSKLVEFYLQKKYFEGKVISCKI